MTESSGTGPANADGAGDPVAGLLAFVQSMQDRERSQLSPEAIRAEVEERVGAITGGLSTSLAGTYQGYADDDEQVMAEVDGRGKLIRVDISPYAMRDMDAAELSRACGEAIASARKALEAELRVAVLQASGQEPPEETPDPEDALREAQEKFRRDR